MINYIQLLLKVHIHPVLWIIIAISVLTANFKAVLLLLLIIFIHEMGHAISAHFFSWRIKSVMLLPFGGVAEVEEHGNRPLKEELIVVISGPLQHIWLQATAFCLWKFGIVSVADYELFTFYNLSILLFNLLPIWPLDGGKLLFILFSCFKSFRKAHSLMLSFSIAFLSVYIIAVLFLAPMQLNLWIIISFLIFCIVTEYRQRMYAIIRFLLERYYGKQTDFHQLKPLVVNEVDSIYDVLLQFQRGCKHPIIIEKDGRKVSQLDENELLHAYFIEKRTTSTVGELVYTY
ncbi:M50 family metallopeptidase [Metabacillus fastidiosus]|uniref:M50 family metallopeptidase n=1 Tax=Metabacillus fastidiosus TaxID=1458 RepID=UPI003D27638D